jgi:hypothetical protein
MGDRHQSIACCHGSYNQEAAKLHSCLNRQQVVVRNDDLGMGGREYRVTIVDTKG